MKILNKYNYLHKQAIFSKTSFTSSSTISEIKTNKGSLILCHDTNFFRDNDILVQLKHYLQKNFRKGTTILDFGCSDGSETYSLAMLLSKPTLYDGFKLNKKYKIIGYDVSPQQIQNAQSGIISVFDHRMRDGYLINSDLCNDAVEREQNKMFNNFFTLSSESPPNLLAPSYYGSAPEISTSEKFYKLKNASKFREIVQFKEGNISDISELNTESDGQKPGVIIFKNAWYHLTNNLPYEAYTKKECESKLQILNSILSQMHQKLDDEGMLVVGNLSKDHIFKNSEQKYGKIHASFRPSPFHELLVRNGFKPIPSSRMLTSPSKYFTNRMSVFTIWKKTTLPVSEKDFQTRMKMYQI